MMIADDSHTLSDRLNRLLQAGASANASCQSSSAGRLMTFSAAVPGAGSTGKLEVDASDQPELAATLLDTMGQVLLNRGCMTEATALIQQAHDMRLASLGDHHPATAASLLSLARIARNEGRLGAAEALARKALAINDRVFGARSYPVALSLYELGVVQLERSALDAAEESASRGLDILESLHLDRHDPNLTRLLDVLGRVRQMRGDHAWATEIYTRVLALDLEQVGAEHPKYATHLANFATVKETTGRLHEAAGDYRKAIEIYERIGRDEHPNVIDFRANLAAVLLAMGHYGDAESEITKVRELNDRVRGAGHYLLGRDHVSLARLAFERDDEKRSNDTALRELEAALDIYRSKKTVTSGTDSIPGIHGFIAEALTWKGRVLLETKQGAAAEQALREAVSIWDVDSGPDTVEHAVAEAYLGRALQLQNSCNPEAARLLKKGYCRIVAVRGADSGTARLLKPWLDDALEAAGADPCA